MKSFIIISIVLFSLFTDVEAKKIYKWKDKNGTITYSKTPPNADLKIEEIAIKKEKQGNAGCCMLVHKTIGIMLSDGNYKLRREELEPLFMSKGFNTKELNAFVSSRIREQNISYSKIKSQAYNKCMHAGFRFCRSPILEISRGEIQKNQSSAGSGFFVNKKGYIITNHHVAGSCKKIRVLPLDKDASLIAIDKKNDLALIHVNSNNIAAASFKSQSAHLGEEVITAGFPYKNLLSSSVKITKGIISSLAGIKDDVRVFQITASIQPGNSGGPLIDSYGNVVGVIVSKLNSKIMLKHYDEIPQNINFAIKGKYVKKFLKLNNIEIVEKSSTTKKEVTTISQAAQNYTVEINCIN